LLLDVARQYQEIKDEEAEVLAIVKSSDQSAERHQHLKLPYPLLADEDGRVHRDLGAVDLQEHNAAAVYVTDRFGKVFGVYRMSDGQPLPRVVDILKWLAFINIQCPECEPPEWPPDRQR
jgi:peroxiredoxin